jgi:hypothetical protein
VEDDTRVRWAWLHSLIVVMNCCHSWHIRGSRVVRFYLLQGVLLIRISVTPSDMDKACSPHLNVLIELHF